MKNPSNHVKSGEEVTLTLDIDFNMLHKQKQLLLKELEGKPESLLWGIVHMIDEIQDKGEELGLWKFPD